MGKTKTSFVEGPKEALSGEEKYKARKAEQEKKKAEAVHIPGLKGGQRVKVVSSEPILQKETVEAAAIEKQKRKTVKIRGLAYKNANILIDKLKLHPISEAVSLLKKTSISKFDGTVELHLVVKKEGVSVNVKLPHAGGRVKKVEFADEKTIEKLKEGRVDFDVLLATADMMPKLVPFAKILGPRGLMPNPKNGTLVKDQKSAEKFSVSTVTIKTERKAPLIHTTAGKVSMDEKDIVQNIEAILSAIGKRQIVKAYVCASMSPSIKLLVE